MVEFPRGHERADPRGREEAGGAAGIGIDLRVRLAITSSIWARYSSIWLNVRTSDLWARVSLY